MSNFNFQKIEKFHSYERWGVGGKAVTVKHSKFKSYIIVDGSLHIYSLWNMSSCTGAHPPPFLYVSKNIKTEHMNIYKLKYAGIKTDKKRLGIN